MKQQEVFKKIGGILQELTEQYDYLTQNTPGTDDVELELFIANANFLKDHAEILRKLNLQKSTQKPEEPKPEVLAHPPVAEVPVTYKPIVEKPATVYEEKFFEPVVQQLKPAHNEPADPHTEKEAEKKDITTENDEQEVAPGPDEIALTEENIEPAAKEEPETIRHELIIDEADLWDDEDEDRELYNENDILEAEEEEETVVAEPEPAKPETPPFEFKPEPIPVYNEVKPVIAEPAIAAEDKKEPLTIHQRMANQSGEKKEPVQSISDLKAAINLNDKLLYIKDLFNGYSLAYSEAIEILNRFNSFEEAERFLNANYVTKNDWQGKPATTQRFYDLLKRRYS